MMWDGTKNLSIILLVKQFTILGPLDDLKGTHFSHLVKYSIAIKMNIYPSLELWLITPMKSKAQIANVQGETIITNSCEGVNLKLSY